jgi:hypothetical protein
MAEAKDEKNAWRIVKIILGIVVIAFTLGLLIKPKDGCDLDRVYLWCRVHPFTLFDFIGILIFYAGAFVLSGIWRGWLTLYNPVNSAKWNLVAGAAIALGIILFWNL